MFVGCRSFIDVAGLPSNKGIGAVGQVVKFEGQRLKTLGHRAEFAHQLAVLVVDEHCIGKTQILG